MFNSKLRKAAIDNYNATVDRYEKVAKTVFRPKNYRKIKAKQAIKRSFIFKIVRRIIKRK